MAIVLQKSVIYLGIDNVSGSLHFKKNDVFHKVKSVSGYLTKIKKETYQYQEEFIDKLVFHLEEPENEYIISFGFNTNIARSFLNMLASIPDKMNPIQLQVSTYRKDKFIKIFVLLENQKLPWKYSPKELPKEDPDEFYEKIFSKIEAKLKFSAEEVMLERSMSIQDGTPVEADDDRIPF